MMKQMRKRLLAIGLMLVIAISVGGCSSSKADSQIIDKIDNSTIVVDNESSKSDIVSGSTEPIGTTGKLEDTESSGNKETLHDTSESETTAGQGGTSEIETSTKAGSTGEQNTTTKKPEQTTEKPNEETTTWNEIPIPEPTISEEEKLAMEIVNSIITNDMSEFEKALVIHDWLAYNVTYAHEAEGYDELVSKYNGIEVTLTEGKAVCGGYARAYELMCNLAGLEVNYVISNKCNHAWNQVKIDGKWYNVDVTNDSHYNKGTQKSVTYEYFLFSDKSGSSLLHIMDAGPYETCSYDYDIKEIMEYSLKNTIVKNVYYCTSKEEAIKKLSSAIEAGENRCTLWLDVENLPEGHMPMYFGDIRTEIMSKYGVLVEDIEHEQERDGIWTYNIGIHNLDSIPVVTTYQELVDTVNSLYYSNGRHRYRFYILYTFDEYDEEMWKCLWEDSGTYFDSFGIIWDASVQGGPAVGKFEGGAVLLEIQRLPRVGDKVSG